MTESTANDTSNSPAFLSGLERLQFALTLASFDQDKHLKNREHQYVNVALSTHGIFIIRETEDGWWKEALDVKGDPHKQLEKLKADPTVACGWAITPRFTEKGGWADPDG